MELNQFKAQYTQYLSDEIKDRTDADKKTFLKEYLCEKYEMFKILKDDLIKRIDDYDELVNQFNILVESLYLLFNERENILDRDFNHGKNNR